MIYDDYMGMTDTVHHARPNVPRLLRRSCTGFMLALAGLLISPTTLIGQETEANPAGQTPSAAGAEETSAGSTEPQDTSAGTDGAGAREDESESREELRSQLQEWRDTLMWGINSEIRDLLPTLTENREEDLLPEVVELFEESTDPGVITEAAGFLAAVESNQGHDHAEQILLTNSGRGEDLLVAVMQYMRDTGATLSEEGVEAVERIAEDRGVAAADAAVQLLGSAGVPSERLIELYEDGGVSDDVRGRILVVLGERGDDEVYDFVSSILGEDEEARSTIQRFAIDTLGKLGDERALPIILRQMGSQDALTRAYAIAALTNFDTREANEALIDGLRDEFWRVRVAALEAIAERRMRDAAPAVMYKVRRDPEQRVRLEAIETLAALDTRDGWELLRERMLSDRTGITERGAIADVLIRQNLGDSRDTILQVVQTEWDREDSRVLDIIGRVVSQVEDQRVAPIAEQLLSHPNYIIQIYGLRAIGRSNLPGLMDVAEARQEEGNHPAVRRAALRSLEQIGPR